MYEKYLSALKIRAETTGVGQVRYATRLQHGLCSSGQPSDEKTSFGPLISQTQRDKVLGYIQSGEKDGARIVAGGRKWAEGGEGYWIEPTIFADVTEDMKCVKEEVSH